MKLAITSAITTLPLPALLMPFSAAALEGKVSPNPRAELRGPRARGDTANIMLQFGDRPAVRLLAPQGRAALNRRTPRYGAARVPPPVVQKALGKGIVIGDAYICDDVWTWANDYSERGAHRGQAVRR
jgi:hypothetical protein